jgi:hypothetical protein
MMDDQAEQAIEVLKTMHADVELIPLPPPEDPQDIQILEEIRDTAESIQERIALLSSNLGEESETDEHPDIG